jgi:protein SCO1/2
VIAGLGFFLSFAILVWAVHLRNTAVRRAAMTDLPRLAAVPPFDVVSEQGTPVTRASYAGKVWIADFIFTNCGGICPVMTSRMKALAAELKDEPNVRFVSFSVDPDRDTVDVLARYAKEAGADPSRWSFLRTDRDRIRALAREGFKLPVEDADPNAGEPILHSSRFVLVDATGTIRGWYDSEDAGKRNLLVRDARRLAADAAGNR